MNFLEIIHTDGQELRVDEGLDGEGTLNKTFSLQHVDERDLLFNTWWDDVCYSEVITYIDFNIYNM